jgi:hypothetical protein
MREILQKLQPDQSNLSLPQECVPFERYVLVKGKWEHVTSDYLSDRATVTLSN